MSCDEEVAEIRELDALYAKAMETRSGADWAVYECRRLIVAERFGLLALSTAEPRREKRNVISMETRQPVWGEFGS